ncbi:MAG: hypothetical protein IJW40_05885 [Clostridia bacterium]|nr:hypothetical protein [Clostridia bacterium]
MLVKKITAVLLICVLLVCSFSCTPVETGGSQNDGDRHLDAENETTVNIHTGSSNTKEREFSDLLTSGNQVMWEGKLFDKTGMLDILSGESFSLCSDPLCQSHLECEISVMNDIMRFTLDPNYEENGPVLIASFRETVLENDKIVEKTSFIRYHFATREKVYLLEDVKLNKTTWSYDAQTQTAYYMVYRIKENTSNETELVLCALDTRSKEVREICVLNEQVIPACISGDILYTDSQSKTLYAIDMSAEEPQLTATDYFNGYVEGGYFYYFVNMPDAVTVSVPDDVMQRLERYPNKGAGEIVCYPKAAYRLDLCREDAEPELVAENIASIAVNHQYILVKEFMPQYRFSTVYYNGKYYLPDAANAPLNSSVSHYIVEHGTTATLLRSDTLEKAADIDLAPYFMMSVNMDVAQDGMVVYLSEQTSEEFMLSKAGAQSDRITAYILFNKPVITQEDIQPIYMK